MDLDTKKHKAIVRESYAARARAWSDAVRPGENVGPMIDLAMPKHTDRMLDVACGAGLVALAFAPLVERITGIDLTPEMIALAQQRAAEKKIQNAQFEIGDAEALTFPAATFDIVACRSTFHHLLRADRALHEMARVLKAGGRIVVYDLLAAEDPKKAERHNEIMKLRDPSHVHVFSVSEWLDLVRRCGLHVAAKIVAMVKREFDDWMAMVGADAQRLARVREELVATEPGDKAGLGVRVKGNRITFSQTAGIWLLSK